MIAQPTFDLHFERIVDVAPESIWQGWTQPDLLLQWFCPLPWKTTACTIDLRPGGMFASTMQGPNGEVHENEGCFLEIIPNEKLVWTNALTAGWRPADISNPGFVFTATIRLQKEGSGTHYIAHVQHKNAADRDTHAAMGFEEGWGKALDQLIALIKTQAAA